MPVRWRVRELLSDEEGLTSGNLLQLIEAACKDPVGASRPANLHEVSYKVRQGSTSGVLSARDARVRYGEDENQMSGFDLPCHGFFIQTTIKGTSLEVSGLRHIGMLPGPPTEVAVLHPLEEGLSSAVVYQGIRDACATQQIEEEARLRESAAAARRKLAAAEREAAAAKRKADFRDGLLAALHAAEEPDPFASIRGDFDFSASDSRQWKTSVQLAGADKCVLLKTPAPRSRCRFSLDVRLHVPNLWSSSGWI